MLALIMRLGVALKREQRGFVHGTWLAKPTRMLVQVWLRRAISGCVFALIGVTAFLQARALTLLLGSRLLANSFSPRARTSAWPAAAGAAGVSAAPIRESRGLESRPRSPRLGSPNSPSGVANLTDPLKAPTCEGLTVFIVTESGDRLWSAATLHAAGEPHARMRRVGDHVADRLVEFIGFNPRAGSPAVWLSNSGGLCQSLLQQPPPVVPVGAPAQAVARKALESDLTRQVAAKIARVSDNEFNVDRSAIEQILENQAELLRFVRVAPEMEDGRAVGLRLLDVRPRSVLTELGFRSGDRIESINGFNVAIPERALEAFAVLRRASNLDIKIRRGSSSVNVAYNVR